MAVPAEIKGYYEAWKKFGKVEWKDLFQKAIQLCEEGFIVEKLTSDKIRSNEVAIRADPNLR